MCSQEVTSIHVCICVSVRCLFSIREVDSAASGSERARVSSQISNNFFWHTHTDAETQRDCLILDSGAFNSPHTLPARTSLHIKTSLMNVLLGQLLRKWRFSSPSLPSSRSSARPLSLSVSTSRSCSFLDLFVWFAEAVLILGLSLSSVRSLSALYF